MLIRCWGARGSIPVSGREYIRYGGNTTCLEIRSENNDVIIIDAGSGIRKAGKALLKEGVKDINIIFTHAHWDHLLGFPFFNPIYFSGADINLFGCPFAQESIERIIAPTMTAPYFPVNFSDVAANFHFHKVCHAPFMVGAIEVTPIMLSHPNQGIGFRFHENGKRFVFLTDNELTYVHEGGLNYKDYVEFSAGADLLVHDSEYLEEEYKTTKMWGHSVYKDALNLALDAGVMTFGLFHHNQERSDDAIDDMVIACKKIIAQKDSYLECFAMYEGQEIVL
ncbi:MAG: MBL fold metallo-hydrolase [Deltaproteobacteria bacterium]|nr:MBL fold metallo-hydrolase [Deltaproteobacteria bacterium]